MLSQAATTSHIYPWISNTYDLGASDAEWRNIYSSGTIYGDWLRVGKADITGAVTFTGGGTLGGNWSVGSSASNTLIINSLVGSDLTPSESETFDIGSEGYHWNDVYAQHLYSSSSSYLGGDVTLVGNSTTVLTIGTELIKQQIIINGGIYSDVVPQVSATFDLGATGFSWNDIYAQHFYGSSSSYIDGTLTLGGRNGSPATDTAMLNIRKSGGAHVYLESQGNDGNSLSAMIGTESFGSGAYEGLFLRVADDPVGEGIYFATGDANFAGAYPDFLFKNSVMNITVPGPSGATSTLSTKLFRLNATQANASGTLYLDNDGSIYASGTLNMYGAGTSSIGGNIVIDEDGASTGGGLHIGTITNDWTQQTHIFGAEEYSSVTSTFASNVYIMGNLQIVGDCNESSGKCADIAETYESRDAVEPGDVVISSEPIVDIENPEIKNSAVAKSDSAYSKKIAGVVTTNPGIVMGNSGINMSGAGWGTSFKPNVALAGRVPVKITTENGVIEPGDLLVSATEPGHAMKWNTSFCEVDGEMSEVCETMKNVAVIGVALESFGDENNEEIQTGKVMAVLRSGFISQDYITAASDKLLGAEVDSDGNLIVTSAIKSEAVITKFIASADNKWSIDEEGNFTTKGLVKTEVDTINGTTTLYGLNSPDAEIMLSGSAELFNGEARIVFEEPLQEIISEIVPIRVNITPTAPNAGSTYVTEKTNSGFKIMKADTGGNFAGTFDWIAIVRRKGYERQTEIDAFNNPITEPVVETPVESPVTETPVETQTEEPAPETPVETPTDVPSESPAEVPVEIPEDPSDTPAEIPEVPTDTLSGSLDTPLDTSSETPVETQTEEPAPETPVET
jgi:hypothetical protein